MTITNDTIIAATGAIAALGTVWAIIQGISHGLKRKKEIYRQAIIDEAKAEMELVRLLLEEKIRKLEVELETQKEAVRKDLSHMSALYDAETKVLGEKIEALRQDLLQQHQSLVGLLTKLVNQ